MEKLAVGLSKLDHKVDVVTYHDSLIGTESRAEGFRVHRVANPVQNHVNIVTWALTFNTELQRVAADIALETAKNDRIVHASEWLCVPAAVQLKRALETPFILSMHSIEAERSAGSPVSGAISYFEKTGCREAALVIVGKESTAEMLQKLYAIPKEHVTILDFSKKPFDELLSRYESALHIDERKAHPNRDELW
jgi:hypothetical protein